MVIQVHSDGDEVAWDVPNGGEAFVWLHQVGKGMLLPFQRITGPERIQKGGLDDEEGLICALLHSMLQVPCHTCQHRISHRQRPYIEQATHVI